MSGTGSDSGWLEAAIAWEVCASLHRQYCKGKDALFTTRQSDFVKHAENARGRAHPAQEARVPLSDGQIEQGHDAADIAPTDATIGTFNDGVRFAEKHHGITAAQEGPAEPDHRAVALAAGAYTTAYSMLSHAEVHNADVDGSTKRLVAAINDLRSALGQPAPVAEDAANWHWLASYLVGPRTDLDDEIVASESVNDLRKLVSAARAQAAQPEGGAKNPCPNCAGTGKTRYRAILIPSQICSECNGIGKI